MLFVTAMRDFPMLSQTPPRGRYYTLKSHKGIFFRPTAPCGFPLGRADVLSSGFQNSDLVKERILESRLRFLIAVFFHPIDYSAIPKQIIFRV